MHPDPTLFRFEKNEKPSKTLSELVDESGSKISQELPWPFKFHCSARMNETHGILTGGTGNSTASLIVR